MISIGKKSKIVNVFGRYCRMLPILVSIVICIEACSKDDNDPENAPPQKERPNLDRLGTSEQDSLIASQDLLSKV